MAHNPQSVVDLTDDSDESSSNANRHTNHTDSTRSSSYVTSVLNPAKRSRVDPSSLSPLALLNPKAYLANESTPSSRNVHTIPSQIPLDYNHTTTSFSTRIEALHGVKDRKVRAQTPKELKRDTTESQDRHYGRNLLPKEAMNGEASSHVIDLTGFPPSENIRVNATIEDDNGDVIINEEETNRELCFGALHTKVLAHREPEIPSTTVLFGDYWPKIACTLSRRSGSKDSIIRVAVENSTSTFGMLSSESAGAIAALYDGLAGGKIRFQCYILPQPKKPENSLGHMILELEVILYGKPSLFQSVGDLLTSKNMYLQHPMEYDKHARYQNPHYFIKHQRLKTGVLQPQPRVQDVSKTAEEIQQDIDRVFDKLMETEAKLPEKEAPDDIVTPLYKHQKQALYWLEEREAERTYDDRPDNPCLWRTKQKGGQMVYFNIITNQMTKTKPLESRGGILADDMGLGKTISCLAHMCSTLAEAEAYGRSGDLRIRRGKDGAPLDTVAPLKCTKATLIIAPLSTISNWEEQLATHVKNGVLSTYIYHGTNREGNIDRLAEYDCIVTTYSTLSQDFMRLRKNIDDVDNTGRLAASPLHHLKFFRIILDEAHVIKDTSTNQSIAACGLHAQRRLCLTGTPLQNRLDDYAALIKFLRLVPFDNKHVWTHWIGGPLKAGNSAGLTRLQLLTSATTLRRSKTQQIEGKPILDLPRANETTRYVYMTPEERQLYELTRKASKNIVDNITSMGQMKEYINILQAIMRLRQICCHRALLANEVGADAQSEAIFNGGNTQNDAINVDELDLQIKKPLTASQAYQLFELMKEAGETTCVGCRQRDIALVHAAGEKEPSKQVLGYLTPCAHPLCHVCLQLFKDCIPNYREGMVARCPVCGSHAEMTMFELRERESADVRRTGRKRFQLDGSDGIEPSSKLIVLMNDLDGLLEKSKTLQKPQKSVVFSQWTTMLDLVEIELRKRNIGYSRLDGSMKRIDRTNAIVSFQSNPETVVMLVSIKAGGLGLNLTAASHVFVFEPAWNPAIEQQAIDRVHRLGQTSDVEVIRYIAKDSIEENMVQLQRKKKELADLVNKKQTKESLALDRLKDLRMLFA